ncbi:hypothetical protein V2J09_017287 [Rumex salicifolius]
MGSRRSRLGHVHRSCSSARWVRRRKTITAPEKTTDFIAVESVARVAELAAAMEDKADVGFLPPLVKVTSKPRSVKKSIGCYFGVLQEQALFNKMSCYTGEDENADHDYHELSSAHSINGMPSSVVEGLSDHSSSPRDEFRDKIAQLEPTPSTMSIAQLHKFNEQRYYLGEAQTEIATMRGDLIAADNNNKELIERLCGVTTTYVLVCLERDQLQRSLMQFLNNGLHALGHNGDFIFEDSIDLSPQQL